MKIKVMIVDDQRLMREGLKTILDLEWELSVVSLAENGRDALEKINMEQPDVVLMDIRMPVMDGVECTGILKQRFPSIKVLILTTFDDDEYIIEALKNGAEGYLLKDLSSEKLVSSIKDVCSGNAIMQPEIAAKLVSHITGTRNVQQAGGSPDNKRVLDDLTDREKEVLRLVGKGLSNKEIMKALYISEGTVKNYISSIYDKLGVNERSKAVLFAIENKFV